MTAMSLKPVHLGATFILLVIAGMLGNHLKFPLFLSIDFIFGSIFAMLAVQMFSLRLSVLAGALIASYTVVLWSHPYFLLIATAEVAIVGVLFHRYRIGLVLADALFWLVVGMPVAYLTYHGVMDVPVGSTTLVMSKSAINGITNALVARLFYTLIVVRFGSAQVEYRDLTYNLLAVFALLPALGIVVVDGRAAFATTDENIRAALFSDTQRLSKKVDIWLQNRATPITVLASMAASHTPEQMQPSMEQSRTSDINLLRIALINKDAKSVALSPQVDEFGHNNLGKDFSDRPYIPTLKQTLKPVVSEVVLTKVGRPTPSVILAAPVVIGGDYAGYVAGVLSLAQVMELFGNSSESDPIQYTLLDKNANVIISTVPNQKLMTPLLRGAGTFRQLGNGVSQWVPGTVAGAPVMERWKSSVYVSESPIGQSTGWTLVVEQPVAPFQKVLYARSAKSLSMLLVILLMALAMAELISRRSIRSLVNLSSMTQALPKRLLSDDATIDWPKTKVSEVSKLIVNFKEMAQSLTSQFNTVKQNNELLEARVQERTAALYASLKDRDALLKEVHHRVKNNMQVITSLLRLEGHRSTVDDTKIVLGDMRARIRAMALMHESLYRTDTFSAVDLGGYLGQLSTQAFQTQSTNSSSVQLELNLGSVQVGMDQAIPCGLLVNELISNCLKHGFPAGVTGNVRIDLQPLNTENQWQLRVCDTGVGLPENFEDKRKNSLGLQLVTDLARQLGGELKITPNHHKGVAFTVNFRVLEPAPLVMPD